MRGVINDPSPLCACRGSPLGSAYVLHNATAMPQSDSAAAFTWRRCVYVNRTIDPGFLAHWHPALRSRYVPVAQQWLSVCFRWWNSSRPGWEDPENFWGLIDFRNFWRIYCLGRMRRIRKIRKIKVRVLDWEFLLFLFFLFSIFF